MHADMPTQLFRNAFPNLHASSEIEISKEIELLKMEKFRSGIQREFQKDFAGKNFKNLEKMIKRIEGLVIEEERKKKELNEQVRVRAIQEESSRNLHSNDDLLQLLTMIEKWSVNRNNPKTLHSSFDHCYMK